MYNSYTVLYSIQINADLTHNIVYCTVFIIDEEHIHTGADTNIVTKITRK